MACQIQARSITVAGVNYFTLTISSNVGLVESTRFDRAQTSMLYQKVAICFEKVSVGFSVAFSGHLKLTNLVENIQLRRVQGVNCYAFALGRVPSSIREQKDPVPGANFVNDIRMELVGKIGSLLGGLKIRKGSHRDRLIDASEVLKTVSQSFQTKEGVEIDNFDQIIKEHFAQSTNLQMFILSYFQKDNITNLTEEEFGHVKHFLLQEYKVLPGDMRPEIISTLLELDGLIKINERNLEALQKDHGIGSSLIATFCRENDDYHFIRLMDDGWYERHGDIIQKRPNSPEYIPDNQSAGEGFYPNKEKDFVGYFIVPTTILAIDGIGRKFLFESHKT